MFTEVQQLCFSLWLSNSCILLSAAIQRSPASPLSKYRHHPQPFGKPHSGQPREWTVLFLCPARVTSSAAANSSRMNSRRDMTAEKVGRSEVIMDCYRSRMIARVPRVAEMSAGFIKRHRESFWAAGGKKVCRHHSFCVNYTFPPPPSLFFHYTCVQRRLRGTVVLWCQTTPDSAAAAALSCVTMLQHHPAVRMWYCIRMRSQGD